MVNSKDVIPNIKTQLTTLARCNYSNPPANGARIAAMILKDKQLFQEWFFKLDLASFNLQNFQIYISSIILSFSKVFRDKDNA